jgi:phosphatidylserine/phosphatidylglycerophosphate/cardiolipin synthase-like enzyme
VYSTLASGTDSRVATFIHSKVLIVDDRLLCIGSANLTTRSLLLDTELCLAWEASSESSPLARCIGNARAELLAEHTGVAPDPELFRVEGLLSRLEALRESGRTKLNSA